MTLREAIMATSISGEKVDVTLTFAGQKSGQLVYYTAYIAELALGDLATTMQGMIDDAYTWYGITPP